MRIKYKPIINSLFFKIQIMKLKSELIKFDLIEIVGKIITICSKVIIK